ncbi:MAG: tyrosine-protein phosphatase [Clostridia bacterium]|nr:tyrosine-protein phosphatase [Clostridia bacterium]
MMKRIAVLTLALTLLLTACGAGARLSPESGTATAETLPAYEGPLPRAAATWPEGETDVVSPEIRAYLEAAKAYEEGDYSFTVKGGEELGNQPKSARLAWRLEHPEAVKEAAVILSARADLSQPRILPAKAGGEEGSLDVYNLETGADYYWALRMTLPDGRTVDSDVFTFRTLPGPRILSISGVKNARDLGGWPTSDGGVVREGVVFRAAKLEEATGSGQKTMLETLGVKTELDLRNPESEDVTTSLRGKVRYVNISSRSYAAYFTSPERAASILRIFTKPANYPVIFHCAGGADRTGALGFLLNALCGVDERDLVCDYELTPNRFRTGLVSGEHNFDFPAFITALRSRPGDTIREKAWRFYRDECGVSQMELENVVAMLTGESAVFTDPPKAPVKADGGKAVYRLDLRRSGGVAAVTTASGRELPFNFESGVLTVDLAGAEETAGAVAFRDGASLSLLWETDAAS